MIPAAAIISLLASAGFGFTLCLVLFWRRIRASMGDASIGVTVDVDEAGPQITQIETLSNHKERNP